MNKKLLCLLIPSLLLSGCTSFKKINVNEREARKDSQRAGAYMDKIRSNNHPVIQESTRQWINTTPVTKKQSKHIVPSCPIVINTRSDIDLRQVAQRITQTCHIPVRISADVWNYLNGAGTGSTQQMTGAIPAPDANGMVPLASVGSQPVKVSSGGTSLPELNVSGLPALLQTVSSRLGISWKYEKGRITFFCLETRSFPITYMDSNVAYNAKVVSGTMSSSGSTGSNSSGGMTGDASNTQTTTVEMKSSLYNDLKSEVSSMLTPGTGRMFLSTGSLTVTDTPDVLDSVQEIVNKRNREMSRQVVLNVEILSIKQSSQEQAGIDWNAVFSDGHLGLSLGGAFGDAADNVITSGVSIVDGKLTGSEAFLKALSSQGDVTVVTRNSAVTKNLTPVPMQIASQQGFIESVTTDTTANVGSSTSLNAATITTGFNMTLLPYIQPDSQNLQLLFSMSLSDKPTFEIFESGGSKAQTPNVDLKTVNQTIDLKSGQTVILSGFQQSNRKVSKQGVITPSFFGFGGGVNSEDDDTILVVLITPNVINSGNAGPAVIKNVN
ncbi:PilN family type IVB pilus formation outer membrane protein [Salmonella enterica subsp. enterica serovar 4,[5],12:b:-]|nr:PilN family type IVB pilus formation outer membrane protein [Salmonella enterica subsp. enterica serovar 4,[5],12:b:-]